MSSLTLQRDEKPVLAITAGEMENLRKLLKDARGTGQKVEVHWDRAGDVRVLSTKALENALDTHTYNLQLFRHGRIKSMPAVYVQIGQTFPLHPAPPPVVVEAAEPAPEPALPVEVSAKPVPPPPVYRRESNA